MTETDGEPDKTETGAPGLPDSSGDAPSPAAATPESPPETPAETRSQSTSSESDAPPSESTESPPAPAAEPATEPTESEAAEVAAFRAARTMAIDVSEVELAEPPSPDDEPASQPTETRSSEKPAAESPAPESQASESPAAESPAAESPAAEREAPASQSDEELAAFRAAETMEIDPPEPESESESESETGSAPAPATPGPSAAEGTAAVSEPAMASSGLEAPPSVTTATTPAPRATKIEMAETVNLEGHERESQDRSSFGLIDRLLMVVSAPSELFSRLTPGTGWAIPLVFVMAASLGQATVSMNLTDVDRWFEVQQEKQKAAMPDWQKRALARMDEKARRTQKRMQLFALKMALFVLPLITTLAGLVVWSTLLFVASAAGEGRRNFALALSVVAHAQMLYVYQSFALAVTAAGTGLPMPQSSLVALSPMAGDVGSALLAWTDPFFYGFVLLLALGLIHGMKVRSRTKALGVLLVTLALVFGGSVGARIAAAKFMPGANGAMGKSGEGMGGGRRRGRRRGRGPF